jgi:hypothetical protein
MNDFDKVVLSKVISDDDARRARPSVLPGEYPVDFTVRVHGVAKVGEDYDRPATTSVPWLEATAMWQEVGLAAFDDLIARFDRGEVTRDDLTAMKRTGFLATEVLVDCIRKALLAKSSAVGTVSARVEEVSEGIERVKSELVAPLPRQHVPGRVKLDVLVDDFIVASAEKVAEAVARTQAGVEAEMSRAGAS